MLHDVHRQRGLAHRRPRGDDNHLAWVQAGGHFVQIGEAGLHTGSGALVFEQQFDLCDRIAHMFGDFGHVHDVVIAVDRQHCLLHLAHQPVDLAGLVVRIGDGLGAGLDHPAQQGLIPDDLKIILEVCRRRHAVLQFGEVGHTTDVVQLPGRAKLVGKSQQIDRGCLLIHRHHRGVNGLVPEIVKHRLVLDLFDAGREVLLRIEQDTAQHALLGGNVIRRGAPDRDHGLIFPLSGRVFQILFRQGRCFGYIRHDSRKPETHRLCNEEKLATFSAVIDRVIRNTTRAWPSGPGCGYLPLDRFRCGP